MRDSSIKFAKVRTLLIRLSVSSIKVLRLFVIFSFLSLVVFVNSCFRSEVSCFNREISSFFSFFIFYNLKLVAPSINSLWLMFALSSVISLWSFSSLSLNYLLIIYNSFKWVSFKCYLSSIPSLLTLLLTSSLCALRVYPFFLSTSISFFRVLIVLLSFSSSILAF